MPVPFTVVEGGHTSLNVKYETDEGLGLWDISVITGAPDSYKILPVDMSILVELSGP